MNRSKSHGSASGGAGADSTDTMNRTKSHSASGGEAEGGRRPTGASPPEAGASGPEPRWRVILYENQVIPNLDLTLCKLESLGTVLTQLTTMECQEPDLPSLADLGRLIAGQAMVALEMLYDGEEITDPFLKFDIQRAATQKGENGKRRDPNPEVRDSQASLPAKTHQGNHHG